MLEKTLEGPLDCKEIQPVHSEGDQPWDILEGMMLNLKLQYFGHLMWSADSLEKTLMLGGFRYRRRRGRQDAMAGWHHWLDGLDSEWTPGVGDGQGGLLSYVMGSQRVGHDWATELNWTETEDIKKRWQEYTEELYQKDLHDPDNHNGVITHLEPDILECEVNVGLRKHHYEQS